MNKKNKMETLPMMQLVFEMSLPMMLSLLIQSLYNIVDSMFVARLSEQALTATSLAYPVQMLMIAVGVGTAVGLNAVLSKALGARNKEAVSDIAATGLSLAVISALVFTVCGLLFSDILANAFTADKTIASECSNYLWICMVFSLGNMVCMTCQRLMQATGKTFLSMVILIVGAVTNIVLDPIMIFGMFGCPALGIRGAAIATVIGQWVSMFTGILLQIFCNKEVPLTFSTFRPRTLYMKAIYKIGFPTIIMQAMQSMMVTCFNAILQPFSITAVAFFGVYYKLQTFLFMPMNGLGQAAIPIVGFNLGAQKPDRIRQASRIIYLSAVMISVIGTALFMIFPSQLLKLFAASPDMLALGVIAIRIIAPTFALASVTMISGYIASGLQDGMTNMLGAMIRQFIPLIPCAWLMGHIWGIGGIWFAFWIAEVCGTVFAVLRIRSRFRTKLQ